MLQAHQSLAICVLTSLVVQVHQFVHIAFVTSASIFVHRFCRKYTSQFMYRHRLSVSQVHQLMFSKRRSELAAAGAVRAWLEATNNNRHRTQYWWDCSSAACRSLDKHIDVLQCHCHRAISDLYIFTGATVKSSNTCILYRCHKGMGVVVFTAN